MNTSRLCFPTLAQAAATAASAWHLSSYAATQIIDFCAKLPYTGGTMPSNNAEAHELEARIAENVARLLGNL